MIAPANRRIISVRRGVLENFVPITASRIALSTLGFDAWAPQIGKPRHCARTQAMCGGRPKLTLWMCLSWGIWCNLCKFKQR